jgi:hypothetical protein
MPPTPWLHTGPCPCQNLTLIATSISVLSSEHQPLLPPLCLDVPKASLIPHLFYQVLFRFPMVSVPHMGKHEFWEPHLALLSFSHPICTLPPCHITLMLFLVSIHFSPLPPSHYSHSRSRYHYLTLKLPNSLLTGLPPFILVSPPAQVHILHCSMAICLKHFIISSLVHFDCDSMLLACRPKVVLWPSHSCVTWPLLTLC